MKLLFLFLFPCICFGQIETVCSSGCSYTTFAAAYAAAGAQSIIQINDNSVTNEGVYIQKNIAGVQGLNEYITLGCSTNELSAPYVFDWSPGQPTQPCTVQNITIARTGSDGGLNRVVHVPDVVGVGSKYIFKNVIITSNQNSTQPYLFRQNGAFTTAGQIQLINCVFDGGGISGGCNFTSPISIVGAVSIVNCLFKNQPVYYGLNFSGSTGAGVYNVFGCDFIGNIIGVQESTSNTIKNCLFIGNTTDVSVSGSGSKVDFSYCGFGQLASGAGTGSIYGLTKSREFCDQKNYFLSPIALSRGTGVSISGITNTLIGIDGILQGWTGFQDMGCNPYTPALCPGLGAGK